MSNRRKPIPPADYSHLISEAVIVPITLGYSSTDPKIRMIFYGVTRDDFTGRHIRDAMERRNITRYSLTALA